MISGTPERPMAVPAIDSNKNHMGLINLTSVRSLRLDVSPRKKQTVRERVDRQYHMAHSTSWNDGQHSYY